MIKRSAIFARSGRTSGLTPLDPRFRGVCDGASLSAEAACKAASLCRDKAGRADTLQQALSRVGVVASLGVIAQEWGRRGGV
jgi:hypothetical protein